MDWVLADLTSLAFIDIPHHGPVVLFDVTAQLLPLLDVLALSWEVVWALAAEAELFIRAGALYFLSDHVFTFLNEIWALIFMNARKNGLAQVDHLILVGLEIVAHLVL